MGISKITAMSFSRHEDEFQATLRQLVSDLQAVKKKVGDDRSRGIKSCEGLVTELKEMQGELDVAVSDLSGSEQKAAMQRITNYKKETTRLTEELKYERNARENTESLTLFSEVDSPGGDQQTQLMDQQKGKLARGTANLRMALAEVRETEEVGMNIMEQLSSQRETIMRVDGNIGRSDESVSRSSGLLKRMHNMDVRDRIITIGLGVVLFIGLIVLLLVFLGVLG